MEINYQKISASRTLDPLLLTLINHGSLTTQEAKQLSEIAAERRQSPSSLLIEQRKVGSEDIALSLSQCLQLNYIDLNFLTYEQIPQNLIPDAFIKKHHVLPIKIENNILYVGIREPNQLSICKELSFQTSLKIQPVVTDWHKLSQLIADYLNQQQYQIFNYPTENIHLENDHRVIHFVEHMILDAVQKSASDIHLEPLKNAYRIRFRIDGILHKIAQLPIEVSQRIIARLKIMSKLDIAEKRLPQDGRFNIAVTETNLKDCRISTCPTLFGEKIVIRILESDNISLNIEELGMEQDQQILFLTSIKKPQGLILVTGPTGSGKTLTLYSALNFLNTLDKNISTAEDPIEIELPGLNQVNIHPKANLTFASALRAFLRQDPDILMVGEIRDKETADIAIRAAQTGHLVFSTLHTNHTFETPARLEMMGVSYANLIDATCLIMAQRLIRKLCDYCKSISHPSKSSFIGAGFLESEWDNTTLYSSLGCDHCMKGYRGRTGIFELLPMTDTLKNSFIKKNSPYDLKPQMKKKGWVDLQAAALNKVRLGITSLEEAYRVVLI